LDASGDPLRGAGLSNFLSDIDAVAQIIATRLRFLMGEWYEDLTDGTPAFQALLGQPITMQALAMILSQRILGTKYVTGIQSLQVRYLPAGRNFAFYASVQTQFGALAVANQAGLTLSGLTDVGLYQLTDAGLLEMRN
jgi:hypothetical protein